MLNDLVTICFICQNFDSVIQNIIASSVMYRYFYIFCHQFIFVMYSRWRHSFCTTMRAATAVYSYLNSILLKLLFENLDNFAINYLICIQIRQYSYAASQQCCENITFSPLRVYMNFIRFMSCHVICDTLSMQRVYTFDRVIKSYISHWFLTPKQSCFSFGDS